MPAMRLKRHAAVLTVFAILLISCMLFAFPAKMFACEPAPVVEPVKEEVQKPRVYEKNASGFTEKMYNKVLGREAEASELDYWKDGLSAGSIKASGMVGEFILGQEGSNRLSGYSDSEFVKFLYKTLLNRGEDPEGYDAWISALSSGATREDVVKGFTASQEFADICTQYNVTP